METYSCNIRVDLHARVHALELAQERGVQVPVPDLRRVLPPREVHRDGVPRGRRDGIARGRLDLG
jgi:hypothetical protein